MSRKKGKNSNKSKGKRYETKIAKVYNNLSFFSKLGKVVKSAGVSTLVDKVHKIDLMYDDGNNLKYPAQCKQAIIFQYKWMYQLKGNQCLFYAKNEIKKGNVNYTINYQIVFMRAEAFAELYKHIGLLAYALHIKRVNIMNRSKLEDNVVELFVSEENSYVMFTLNTFILIFQNYE